MTYFRDFFSLPFSQDDFFIRLIVLSKGETNRNLICFFRFKIMNSLSKYMLIKACTWIETIESME